MNVVQIKRGPHCGWYLNPSERDPSEWTWNNHSNGIVDPDDVLGPYPSERLAREALAEELADSAT